MCKLFNKIKKDIGNSSDIQYKTINKNKDKIILIYSEVLTSSSMINDFILRPLLNMDSFNINNIPINNIEKLNDYNLIIDRLLSGYLILLYIGNIYTLETRIDLSRGVSLPTSEPSIRGPKDAFCEHFNTNLGLIRRRIPSRDLFIKTYNIGKHTKTSVGLIYMNNIVNKDYLTKVSKKIKNINIDGIIDSGYIKRYIEERKSIFPSVISTERCDMVSQALLEGKICILVDNSCYVLILPTFFIDYFHTPDDYYQKPIHISFIRIIRLFGFLVSILLPSFYIASTTINKDILSSSLLTSFLTQRKLVPFPSLVEATIMSISFEILRESDVRSSTSSAVSILGGIVLGEAAVSAGIVSPIMIIVIALSAISGLLFSSVEMISAIRWWRYIFMFLGATFGMYGMFLGIIFLVISLEKTNTHDYPYLYPFSPINFYELKDSFIKKTTKKKKRNELLTKNITRGKEL